MTELCSIVCCVFGGHGRVLNSFILLSLLLGVYCGNAAPDRWFQIVEGRDAEDSCWMFSILQPVYCQYGYDMWQMFVDVLLWLIWKSCTAIDYISPNNDLLLQFVYMIWITIGNIVYARACLWQASMCACTLTPCTTHWRFVSGA